MRLQIIGAAAIAFAASAFVAAQTPASSSSAQTPSTAASSANQTMTLSGCVTPGANASDPFTLSGASIVPSTSTPGVPTSPATPPASASALPPTTGAAGTTGSGATGATGTTGTVGAAGTASSAAGVPPAVANLSTAASVTGYRLSGADMSSFAGQRVQIVGGLVPSANAAATAGASSSGVSGQTGMTGSGSGAIAAPSIATLPEFRVVSVKPISGPCPPK